GSREHFFGRDYSVAVDRDRVFDVLCVASGKGDHHRDIARTGDTENQFVPLFEPLDRQVAPAQLIFLIWVPAGDITNQIRLELAQARAEGIVQPREVVIVAGSIGKIDIDGGGWLPHWVIIVLVQRDGEDVPGVGSAHFAAWGVGGRLNC